jgi:hypothetical protein
LYNTEHTHTHKHFFPEYRLFWISLARSPDFISIRVYLHIQGYTSHTHRHTHVLNLCLSLIFMCMWSREGGVPSLSRCVYAV